MHMQYLKLSVANKPSLKALFSYTNHFPLYICLFMCITSGDVALLVNSLDDGITIMDRMMVRTCYMASRATWMCDGTWQTYSS